jgi:hypothetical protein
MVFHLSRGLPVPVILLLGAALLPGRARAGDAPRGKKYALLVGVKEYNHNKLPNLRYTENDVEALATILSEHAGFHSVTVLTTTRGRSSPAARPTAANVKAALRKLMTRRTKHDLLLVALSGHGLQLKLKDARPKDQSFFCPADADPADPGTLVGLTPLMDDLDACGARVKLLLVDACRNEVTDAERSVAPDSIKPAAGIAALFSCAAGQKSHETAKFGKGHGLFFHFVLQGLAGKAVNEDGEITWDDLTTYVKRHVPRAAARVIGDGAQQSPHLVSNLVNTPVLRRVGKPPAKADPGQEKPDPGETRPATPGADDRAVSWLRAHVRHKKLVPQLTALIDRHADEYNGMTLLLGKTVTGSGAYRLELWAGEFFPFPLSQSQARALKVQGKTVQYIKRARGLDERVTPVRAKLGAVTLDGGMVLDGKKSVRGEVVCDVMSPPGRKVALRLSYSVEGETESRLYPLKGELEKGKKTLRFSFPAIHNRGKKDYTGPLVLFLDLCRLDSKDGGGATLLSNTRAALIDVTDDPER